MTPSILLVYIRAMEDVQYPAVATIRAFGGLVVTANALGLNKQNVHQWQKTKSGLIPRWWSDRIKVAADAHGVKLPKPKKVV